MPSSTQFTADDALELATYGAPSWNEDGTYVGYQRFADGETAFVARPVGPIDTTDFSLDTPDTTNENRAELSGDVSEHEWRPGHETTVAVVRDGDVVLFDVETQEEETVAAAEDDHASLAWHPDGDPLAYVRDGTLWLHDVASGSIRELSDAVANLFGPTPVEWSASGRYLATLTATDEETLALTVYEPFADDGEESSVEADEEAPIAWERAPSPADQIVADTFDWAGDVLAYAEDSTDGTDRRYRVVRPDEERSNEEGFVSGDVVLAERDERGLPSATLVGHESGRVALLAAPSGYHHVYVLDVAARCDAVGDADGLGFDGPGLRQVTTGDFEARGDATDAPAWDDAGERLAYVTNEHDAGERRLHVATIDGEIGDGPLDDAEIASTTFDEVGGNAVHPTWRNGRVACLRAGRTTPADVHVFDPETDAVRRVSAGHPSPDALDWFPEPEPVAFESSMDGREVHGYLYTPPDGSGTASADEDGPADGDGPADRDRPAVVWAHGGPVRQMRRGFHHMRSYAFFHAFNHVLVDRGYVVLELNYRGGIGYGRDYEKGIHRAIGEIDVRDCVDAAAALRAREEVGDSVGLWGLSYGGFLANAVATKTDAFDCAVNFAGIWDWRDWIRYATGRNWGAGRRFVPLFGGHPDDDAAAVEERYVAGSPRNHAEGLDTPLFALHGTDDPNVPFAQMDDLVADLVERGDDFEMAYYPEEDHMFQRSETWRDALDRVLPFLDEHLRP